MGKRVLLKRKDIYTIDIAYYVKCISPRNKQLSKTKTIGNIKFTRKNWVQHQKIFRVCIIITFG